MAMLANGKAGRVDNSRGQHKKQTTTPTTTCSGHSQNAASGDAAPGT
jgi:hypothetical protein